MWGEQLGQSVEWIRGDRVERGREGVQHRAVQIAANPGNPACGHLHSNSYRGLTDYGEQFAWAPTPRRSTVNRADDTRLDQRAGHRGHRRRAKPQPSGDIRTRDRALP